MDDDEEFLIKRGALKDENGSEILPPEEARRAALMKTIPDTEDIKEMAKAMTPHIIREFFMIALDGEASSNVRIQAGKEIIERGHGKSASEVPAVAVQVNIGDKDPEVLKRELVFLDRLRGDVIEVDDE